ncbi:MAG: NAD(P)/FAD-dependent oxidoreductase [Clostridiales bacterium]|nr:NAD(P)/FAD-dependent oxidoreductase [Clostridiales bacterium]
MKYDIIIVGAGVVGTSIAYRLISHDVSVLLIDKNNDVAMGATRANSAIVHAGYDPLPGTLMARLNVEGNAMYEPLCADLDVPFRRCGSLVLAFSDAEKALLNELLDRGLKNGVPNLRILDSEELRKMEPEVSEEAVAALYAPTAGIVNPWEFCLAQAEVFVRNGGTFLGNCEVTGIRSSQAKDEKASESSVTKSSCTADKCETKPNETVDASETDNGGIDVTPIAKSASPRYTLTTTKGDFEASCVILACGVNADSVHGLIAQPDFQIVPTRGEYFLLDKSEGSHVDHVIFQCPNKFGKGVLVAPTVHGNLICGPTSEVLKEDIENTATTSSKLAEIKEKAARSVQSISWRDNVRNFSGIRANSTKDDFIIREIPGNEGIFEAAGIKSPGLVSSPAIAKYMIALLIKSGIALPEKKSGYDLTRKKVHFRDMNNEERAALVKKDPAYGRIVCRCEGVTEGEIRDALESPIPPMSLDAVKRRAGTGMGRCQGGFCGPRIVEMLLADAQIPQAYLSILQDAEGSNLFYPRDAETPDNSAFWKENREVSSGKELAGEGSEVES